MAQWPCWPRWWRQTGEQFLERRPLCIHVDKDLVLPATGTSGPVETFFVVASTDMERVGILMDRIRDQIGSVPRLKAGGSLRVTAEKIPTPSATDPNTLEQQVWGIADYVTEVIQQGLGSKQNLTEQENHENAHCKLQRGTVH